MASIPASRSCACGLGCGSESLDDITAGFRPFSNGLKGRGFPSSCRPDDQHDPHTVHIHILKERRPCAGLEDVQVLAVEVFRMRMADMRSEDRRESRMMVLGEPHGEDIELVIAWEHRIES